MLKRIFHKKLFVYLVIGFIVATIVGTVSHEMGHYIVGKSLGYTSTIHYKSTGWTSKESPFLDSCYEKYRHEIEANLPFPQKEKLDTIESKMIKDGFWFTLGGPMQTMLTGTIGLLLLFVYRKKYQQATSLSFKQWLLIFITLFWLRQVANAFTWYLGYFIYGRFGIFGDEIGLAEELNLPVWFFVLATSIIGSIVLAIVLFKFVPLKQRFTFIVGGLVGGVLGYLIWLEWFGKYIMP